MNPTLRTAECELIYATSPRHKIDELKSQSFRGMRMLPNQFPYDLCHQDGVIFMAANGESFLEWWVRMGQAIQEGVVPYDQFVYNIHGQSQPHVPHGHGLNFNKDHVDFLRWAITNRDKLEKYDKIM